MREYQNMPEWEDVPQGYTGNQPVAPSGSGAGETAYGQGGPGTGPETSRRAAGQTPSDDGQRTQSRDFTPDPTRTVKPPPHVSAECVMPAAAFPGSMQYILSQFIGDYCFVDFLIGTTTLMRKEGYLYQVGVSYIVIFLDDVYTVCDFYSIKYATFTNSSRRPTGNASRGSKRTNL